MSRARLKAQHAIASWKAELTQVEMQLSYFRKQAAETEARDIDPSHWIDKIYERELRRNRALVQIEWHQSIIDKIDAKAGKPGFFARNWYLFYIAGILFLMITIILP